MGIKTKKPTKVHIEFTKSSNRFAPLSWLIRLVQWTPYSHVRLRWVNTTGRNLIYEASGSKVKFIGTLAQETLKAEVVKSYEFEVNSTGYRKLIDTCMYYTGVNYSLWQVLQIGILSLFSIKIGKRDGEYAQVCSELVARVLEQVLHVDLGLDPDTAGPKEIDKALSSLTLFTKSDK